MSSTRRQLLAVMFTDIVGYSAMVNRDERRAQALLEFQRGLVRERLLRYDGRIVDTIGDGHLITFGNARAAIECAIDLQRRFQVRNAAANAEPLRLRIGIHVGDVERGPRRVFGNGVNVAARLEPLAPAGGIAASAEAVAQLQGPLRAAFVSQGLRELKNIAGAHEVFSLGEDGLEAAARLLPPPRPLKLAWRRWRTRALAATAALCLSGAVVWAWQTGALSPADARGIAVLPLENLSGTESADFVAGLHDSLLTEIGRVPDLRVISRTSVMRYAKDPPPVPKIARALDVGYVLEGSVQRQGARLRINVQLIRGRDDEHVWAKTYDREAADLFEVQTQIAREIALATEGRLVMDAMPSRARPTRSVEAYDRYLRAIAVEDNDPQLGRGPATAQIALLEEATRLDPAFAQAWAALARYNIWSANWAAYLEPARRDGFLEAAERAARRASALEPQQADTLIASALVAYWMGEDLVRVAERFRRALEQHPGEPTALFWLASVYDRLGDPAGSEATLEALRRVDPYNERVYTLLVQQQLNRRQYAALEGTYRQWRAITEAPAFVDLWAAQLRFYRNGDLDPWREFISRTDTRGVTASDLAYARYQLAMFEDRYADAAALSHEDARGFAAGRNQDFSAALGVGIALTLAGDSSARPLLEAAQRYLDETLATAGEEPMTLAQAALADAWLGNTARALARADRAVQASRPASGAPARPTHYVARHIQAQVLAVAGQPRRALEELEELLEAPSDVHAWAVLRDPLWRSLREDPAFQALVRKHLPRD